jgi:hypothetical protein
MPRHRKPPPHRPTEYEDIARREGWSDGYDVGYQSGREDAMYDRGRMDGYHEGLHECECHAYTEGYTDAKAGRLPKHQPHEDVTPDMAIVPPDESHE